MNLFVARLLKQLMPTAQFEAYVEKMSAEIRRYREVEKSTELKEYNDLKRVVESTDFQTHKRELLTRRYQDTQEAMLLRRLKQLSTSSLKKYFVVLNSDVYKEYLSFKQTEDYQLLADPKQVRQSPKLKRMFKFEHSRSYLNFLNVEKSPDLKEYLQLSQQTSTDEFRSRDAFWRNKKRWLTTEESKQEARLNELAQSADLRFYFAKDVKEVERMEQYKVTFNEQFKNLNNWQAGFGYAAKELKTLHSFANERQANNGGKNCSVAGGYLTVLTKRENAKALAWDESKGFVEKAFDYTSDVMNTAASFTQEEGLFAVKVRAEGKVCHAISLSDGKKKDLVSLFYFNGKKLSVGYGKQRQTISGLNVGDYYIYSLVWNKQYVAWYVNNKEVLRIDNNLPKGKMFFLVQSFIPERLKADNGRLNIERIVALQN